MEVLPGLVITMYELEPAAGVKRSTRITSLTDDLALALMAPASAFWRRFPANPSSA